MADIRDNNKRIARNTLFMYVRLLLVMCVSLFTVRVVLRALGEEDYGINNVVGGVVSMLGFMSSTLSGASMRFFSYEIGRKDDIKLKQYFSVTFWCYLILCFIVVALAETVGLWFVKEKLVIPHERMSAALFVYQCSIVSCVFHFLLIPFNSLILAHEKMDLYAIVGVVEVLLKVFIAFMLTKSGGDKLIIYASLMLFASFCVTAFYVIYDFCKYKESRVQVFWDKDIFKNVFSYSSWSLLGAVSLIFRSQGINILVNIFFGPVYNAARAIAYQVNNSINNFVTGFTQAVRPQQTKYYAAGSYKETLNLTYRATRMCFYLFFFMAVPLMIETEFVLSLWLGNVSKITITFTRLVMCVSIVEAIAIPLKGLISSTGNIKQTQIINSCILISIFPISWIFFKFGFPAETTMIVSLMASISCHITRIIISCRLTPMTVREYLKETLIPILKVACLCLFFPILFSFLIQDTIPGFLLVCTSSVVSSLLSIWHVGLKKNERILIKQYVQNKLYKLKNPA